MLVDHGRRSSALPSLCIRPAPGALVAIRRIRSARSFARYPLLHAAAVRRLIAGFRLPCSRYCSCRSWPDGRDDFSCVSAFPS
jgi:hypothetical protein